jgi:membrane protein
MQSATPPAPDDEVEPTLGPATVRHPRGRLAPPLAKDAPRWRRIARAAHRLGHGLALHDVLLAAPAMAFHFFLSLLPLLIFVGYVVGLIARRRGVDAVLSPLLDNLPGTAESVVKKEVERLAGGSGAALGPVAAATFLWIASGGTHGLMNAVENVIGAPRRPWWKKRVLSLAWVVASLGAFALAAFALVQWDAVMHPRDLRPVASVAATSTDTRVSPSVTVLPSSSSAGPESDASANRPRVSQTDSSAPVTPRRRRQQIIRSGGERVLALAVSVTFAAAVLAAFYRFSVSHSKRVTRRVLPGAALAVVVWMVISWAFGLYVSTLAEYAVFYGSLAAVAVLLVWLWLTSLAILVGAELNSQLEGLRD